MNSLINYCCWPILLVLLKSNEVLSRNRWNIFKTTYFLPQEHGGSLHWLAVSGLQVKMASKRSCPSSQQTWSHVSLLRWNFTSVVWLGPTIFKLVQLAMFLAISFGKEQGSAYHSFAGPLLLALSMFGIFETLFVSGLESAQWDLKFQGSSLLENLFSNF